MIYCSGIKYLILIKICDIILRYMKLSVERKAWLNARNRCTNPSCRSFKHYGHRGIQFRFPTFEQFLEEVGPRPSPEHSLDRINTNGHYEPGNVRWANPEEQAQNMDRNKLRKRNTRSRLFMAPAIPTTLVGSLLASYRK